MVTGGGAKADAGQREVPLLRLDERDERPAPFGGLHGEVEAEHPPRVRGPQPHREDDVLRADRAPARHDLRHAAALALERDDRGVLEHDDARLPGLASELADRRGGVGPATATLVQHRRHARGVDVGPAPREVLRAVVIARDQLRRVAHLGLAGGDRDEILELAFGHHRHEADLAEAERLRRALEALDAHADELHDRRAAVVAADDPAGDARRARPERPALEQHDAGREARRRAPPGERGGDAQPVHAAADHDMRCGARKHGRAHGPRPTSRGGCDAATLRSLRASACGGRRRGQLVAHPLELARRRTRRCRRA